MFNADSNSAQAWRLDVEAPGLAPFSRVLWLPEIGSTNTLALGAREDGLVLVADSQTAGRGRRGNRWASAPGLGLWCSACLAGPPRGLTFAAALAVCDALRPHCAPVLKWPNDIMLAGWKVGGVLVEHRMGRTSPLIPLQRGTEQTPLQEGTEQIPLQGGPELARPVHGSGGAAFKSPFEGGSRGMFSTEPLEVGWSALGIGVNVHHRDEDFPPELREKAGALDALTGRRWERRALLLDVLAALAPRVRALRAGGYEALRQEWAGACAVIGQTIARGAVAGTVVDLAEDGALIVATAAGRVLVRSDEPPTRENVDAAGY